MIRCSECENIKPVELLGNNHKPGSKHKEFYVCCIYWECGLYRFHLWNKVPKGHPRWCPKYKEAKNVKQNLGV